MKLWRNQRKLKPKEDVLLLKLRNLSEAKISKLNATKRSNFQTPNKLSSKLSNKLKNNNKNKKLPKRLLKNNKFMKMLHLNNRSNKKSM